jgi:hypothetical protein
METVEKAPKQYLYHMVPHDMVGSVLHPLNTLKTTHPELYISKSSKYDTRKHVMEEFIPTLECLWNDALHFSPIHPEELKQGLIEAGMEPREMKFFQIDPELLDPEQTTIFLFNNTDIDHQTTVEDFANYNPQDIASHGTIRDITKQLWKEKIQRDGRPIFFVGIPHILHKGSIDISELKVITV